MVSVPQVKVRFEPLALSRRARWRMQLRSAALGLIGRHGFACRSCGLANAWEPVATLDALACAGCGHRVPSIAFYAALRRPWRAWALGV